MEKAPEKDEHFENSATPSALTPAEKMYKSHLRHVKEYQKRNPEKMKEKCKRYVEKRKNDQVRYTVHLEKRRLYYKEVLKPKKQTQNAQLVLVN